MLLLIKMSYMSSELAAARFSAGGASLSLLFATGVWREVGPGPGDRLASDAVNPNGHDSVREFCSGTGSETGSVGAVETPQTAPRFERWSLNGRQVRTLRRSSAAAARGRPPLRPFIGPRVVF
ncbi:hypothetical protein HPB52_001820 [Rhipicephalus sanguineus]|uniref:Uncharacterized protein n=1 Tax=Rhipicephalus sanguineus TaxID=34632 RepID=A0A9D4PD39_RHISA|nr:hypothetical protein HPB52_001820 [Rhipicephalus sanguineus]